MIINLKSNLKKILSFYLNYDKSPFYGKWKIYLLLLIIIRFEDYK